MKRVLAFLCLSVLASAAQAEELNLNLSSEAIRGVYDGSLTDFFPRLAGQYEAGGIYVNNDDVRTTQGHVGLLVSGDAGAQMANINAGLGGRLALLHASASGGGGSANGGALALGGMIEARLPAFNRIGAMAYVYAAPGISSFGDVSHYLEYSVDGDYEVLRNASLYLGFRQLHIGVEDAGSVTLDSGWHLGLRLKF